MSNLFLPNVSLPPLDLLLLFLLDELELGHRVVLAIPLVHWEVVLMSRRTSPVQTVCTFSKCRENSDLTPGVDRQLKSGRAIEKTTS